MMLTDMMQRAGLPRHSLPAVPITGITADSRQVSKGYLFAALPGTLNDGRHFIAAAVASGAAAVLAPLGTQWPPGVPPRPLILNPEPRRALALLAAAQEGAQPDHIVAVTGTNGKTSSVDFLRQFWQLAGLRAASLGTLGLIGAGHEGGAGLTTPDPVALAATLAALAREAVGHLAMEASSHGLDQFRLDGVRLFAAGFSNLTRDHLDYHGTLEAYRAAKMRLFADLLPSGAPAVANADMDPGTLACLRAIAARRGLRLHTVGVNGNDIRLLSTTSLPHGQVLRLSAGGAAREIEVALPGRFQADNVLLAASLAMVSGVPDPWKLAGGLRGVRGRMELVARLDNGAAAYVDYAHTPDALERLLQALRPHTENRLVCVFGAGGDRDPGKRKLMGAVVARHADSAIVTDDNPRSERPGAIRAAILAACPEAREIGDRSAAIAAGLAELRAGDVLVVAGKGHEQGQIVGRNVLEFDDADTIRRIPACDMSALFTADDLTRATGGVMPRLFHATGVSIDSRTVAPGDLFVALQTSSGDGHAHVEEALRKGAAGAMVHRENALPDAAPRLVVRDTLAGLGALAAFARTRFEGAVVAVTGSVGKTTTKEMLRTMLSACGDTHAAEASYNNHWGVPLTLARMPPDAAFCVVEIGMNHAGEIAPLAKLAAPDVGVITAIAGAHLGHLGSLEAIADEKASMLQAILQGGTAVLPGNSAWLGRLGAAVPHGVATVIFGQADVRSLREDADGSDVDAMIGSASVSFRLNAPGRHMVANALAALHAAASLGADVAQCAATLAQFSPCAGRGARHALLGGTATLLDESYNASGASVRAALSVLRQLRERRVAVLGDMLELGEHSAHEHASLARDVTDSADVLYACGPWMKFLYDEIAPEKRGLHAADSVSLAPAVCAAVRAGDAVLVKGSLGSHMRVVVEALEAVAG